MSSKWSIVRLLPCNQINCKQIDPAGCLATVIFIRNIYRHYLVTANNAFSNGLFIAPQTDRWCANEIIYKFEKKNSQFLRKIFIFSTFYESIVLSFTLSFSSDNCKKIKLTLLLHSTTKDKFLVINR